MFQIIQSELSKRKAMASQAPNPRCLECRIGFIDVEGRTAHRRFADHMGVEHLFHCKECSVCQRQRASQLMKNKKAPLKPIHVPTSDWDHVMLIYAVHFHLRIRVANMSFCLSAEGVERWRLLQWRIKSLKPPRCFWKIYPICHRPSFYFDPRSRLY